MRIGITHHALDRAKERIPALADATISHIRAEIERMLATAMPFHRPEKGDRGQLMRTLHEESGQDVVLAVVDQKGCDVRLVTTIMTLEQAKNWKRGPTSAMRRIKQKRQRVSHRARSLMRGGYRDAQNDWGDE